MRSGAYTLFVRRGLTTPLRQRKLALLLHPRAHRVKRALVALQRA